MSDTDSCAAMEVTFTQMEQLDSTTYHQFENVSFFLQVTLKENVLYCTTCLCMMTPITDGFLMNSFTILILTQQ